MLEKINKIFFIVLVFFIVSYIFNQINDYIERENLNKLKYTNNTIENFVYISKSDKVYVLTGEKLIKVKENVNIESPYLTFKDESKSFDLTGNSAIYYGEEKLIEVYDNVKFFSKNFHLSTDKLYIDTEREVAYNYSQNFISSDKMETVGKDLLFNFQEEKIELKDVKTILRGKDV